MKKERKKYIYIGIAIIILISLISIVLYKEMNNECLTDSDCAPSICCHPTQCVVESEAPDCSNTLCTMNCIPETLDCDQGGCICNKGRCETFFK